MAKSTSRCHRKLAGIAISDLGPRVTVIPEYREVIIAATGLLITGV
jgi:hypothetical protein